MGTRKPRVTAELGFRSLKTLWNRALNVREETAYYTVGTKAMNMWNQRRLSPKATCMLFYASGILMLTGAAFSTPIRALVLVGAGCVEMLVGWMVQRRISSSRVAQGTP